jgi:hypothetical protein
MIFHPEWERKRWEEMLEATGIYCQIYVEMLAKEPEKKYHQDLTNYINASKDLILRVRDELQKLDGPLYRIQLRGGEYLLFQRALRMSMNHWHRKLGGQRDQTLRREAEEKIRMFSALFALLETCPRIPG